VDPVRAQAALTICADEVVKKTLDHRRIIRTPTAPEAGLTPLVVEVAAVSDECADPLHSGVWYVHSDQPVQLA
jgi:hypothetical protein